jgi:hypothetical protein
MSCEPLTKQEQGSLERLRPWIDLQRTNNGVSHAVSIQTPQRYIGTMIGGLVFATRATVFLVPTIFRLVHGRRHSIAVAAAAEATSLH